MPMPVQCVSVRAMAHAKWEVSRASACDVHQVTRELHAVLASLALHPALARHVPSASRAQLAATTGNGC